MARRLLGCSFVRTIGNEKIVCRIVETEAYDQFDPASHSYRGMTARNSVMFGEAGHLYVYLSYGIHCCMNVVTGRRGHASGVLIRAVEPIRGLDIVRANRPKIVKETSLTNGPGKVCQAMGIGLDFNGHDLRKEPLSLRLNEPLGPSRIVASRRIGISQARELEWRFSVKDNPYVSVGPTRRSDTGPTVTARSTRKER
jgi:DNA-3-methyladenine glycosylase